MISDLRRHLKTWREAIEAGVKLKGDEAGSLMDHTEWSPPFFMRLGLYHVDSANQKRTSRSRAKVVQNNGALLSE